MAGHKGMVGSAIIRALLQNGQNNLIFKNRSELDLTNQSKVKSFFKKEKPDQVYLAAAKVGGILANNTYPAEFIYQNIIIQANILNAAFENGVKKILFLGSSCIYPKNAKQPIGENELLNGKLESTNEPYAISKIAGIKICESYNRQYGNEFGIDYRCIMPSNLYGPGDNYHPENSHVIPGLIQRIHEAKINNLPYVAIWGTGKVKREFLYVDDLARACIHIMDLNKEKLNKFLDPMCSHINVGSGVDLTIKELAEIIKQILNYKGQLKFDKSKLDGTPRKLLDISLIKKLGWYPKISLSEGIQRAYDDFLKK